MKKRNGFTLVELLAVVVVLVMIMLIAIPTITRLSEETKRKTFEDSAYGLIKAGDLYYSRKEMMGEELVETEFKFPNNISDLEFSGDVPKEGSMIITSDGKVGLAISNGKYCITKKYSSSDITVTKDIDNCILPEYSVPLSDLAVVDPELGIEEVHICARRGKCSAGTAFAIKVNETTTYKFYVIADDGEKVTLIMDRNLGNDVAWISASDYVSENSKDETPDSCSYISCNDEGPITAINALITSTSDWEYIESKPYNYSGIGHDGTTRKYEDITRTMKARMITYNEAKTFGCTTTNGSCPSWLCENLSGTGDSETYGYWTSTASTSYSDSAWYVSIGGFLDDTDIDCDSDIGVRPVIELSK